MFKIPDFFATKVSKSEDPVAAAEATVACLRRITPPVEQMNACLLCFQKYSYAKICICTNKFIGTIVWKTY